jgi:hypothetical protein
MRATHRSVLGIAAAVEAVTGLLLLIVPHLLAKLLLGVEATAVAVIIARIAGVALLSLGIGCWFGRQEASGGWALAAMLLYNVLVTLYLAWVGLGAEFVGVLLWPAVVAHAILTVLLGFAWSKNHRIGA